MLLVVLLSADQPDLSTSLALPHSIADPNPASTVLVQLLHENLETHFDMQVPS